MVKVENIGVCERCAKTTETVDGLCLRCVLVVAFQEKGEDNVKTIQVLDGLK